VGSTARCDRKAKAAAAARACGSPLGGRPAWSAARSAPREAAPPPAGLGRGRRKASRCAPGGEASSKEPAPHRRGSDCEFGEFRNVDAWLISIAPVNGDRNPSIAFSHMRVNHKSSFNSQFQVIQPSPNSCTSLQVFVLSVLIDCSPHRTIGDCAESIACRIVCQVCMQIVVYCISGPTCLVGSMNLYCKHFKQPARAQRNFVPTCRRQGGHARTQTCRTLSCL